MKNRFWPRWMVWVTGGEAAGFVMPALAGGLLTMAGAPPFILYPCMILAGACEGMLLGLGQTGGFGERVVPRPAWVAATAAGAAIAWSIGMLPAVLDGVDFGAPLTLPLVVVLTIGLLLSIPTLQWLVLRRSGHRSTTWIPVNAAAWAVGILWTVVPSPFIDENTPAAVLLAVYVAAGLLMAATVAALTGVAAHRIAGRVLPVGG
jgi:hypothetical protein